MRVRIWWGAVLFAQTLAPGTVPAQSNGRPDSSTVAPGPQYRAGGLKRTLFGTDYRALWITPIRVPVLDLQGFGGGIHPTEEGGGEQTHSLRFKNGAGKEFQFRSVDKDGAGALPVELRKTFVADIVRDQTSSGHPTGSLVVGPLLDAAGILHAPAVLVQMPDDTVLGQFRKKFAGMLGTIEERPDSGFAGGSEVVSTEGLFERLNKDPSVRLDEREFLTARLIDLVVGDWDRHQDQWRWVRFQDRWRPIPRDRDQAFSRYDGWVITLARQIQAKLQLYQPDYPSLGGLTRNSADLDRRLLSGLDRTVFDSIGAWLKERLTDSVLAHAVGEMPPEFPPEHASWLLDVLKRRRDAVDLAALRFYHRLAEVVEVIATDEPEVVSVGREPGGGTLITVAHGDVLLLRRRFLAGETREVRIYLRGGGDQVEVSSDPGARGVPIIRIIGGAGDDRYRIETPAGIRLYDNSGRNVADRRVHLDTKSWRWDTDSLWQHRPKDWETKQSFLPALGIAPDAGVLFGGGGWIEWHGFRRAPYSSRLTYSAVFATTRASGRVSAEWTHYLENSPVFFGLDVTGSGIESLRWYGFGNETVQAGPAISYRVRRNDVRGDGFLGFRFGRHQARLGPVFRWSWTPLASNFNATRFIADDRPYGTGSFKMAGVGARLLVDTRDFPGFARKGFALSVAAEAYPSWLDADSAVARIEAQASIAFAPLQIAKRRPSLHLMAGGIKTWGGLPYFLAPTLGGTQRLRGYYPDRFAGDAAVYGSAEVRLPLTRAKLLFPGEQGVFGFVDVGRVSVRNQPSDTWHHTLGAGVWFSFVRQDYVLFLALARPELSAEGNRLLFGFGFPY